MTDFDRYGRRERVTVAFPDGVDCVLAAGDVSDLPQLSGWLWQLPQESYGRVFIEVFSPIQIQELPVPPGVGVTWLCREQRNESPMPGAGRRRGEALADAVEAWMNEWVWGDDEAARDVDVWMGARTSSVMQSYWFELERRLERHAPGRWENACRACPASGGHGCPARQAFADDALAADANAYAETGIETPGERAAE